MEFLTPLLTELIPVIQNVLMALILAVISTAVPELTELAIEYVKEKITQSRASLSVDLQFALDAGSRIVVAAIEQENVKQALNRTGKEMKEDAVKRLSFYLENFGFSPVAGTILSDAIEAALRKGAHEAWPNGLPKETGVVEVLS